MEYLSWAGQGIRTAVHAYNSINPATLSGAIDIIVCEKDDGELKSTPFHVRFGKIGVLNPKQKVVNISVNGSTVKDLTMKLGEQGEAFFVHKPPGEDACESSESPNPVSPLSTEYESPSSPAPPPMSQSKVESRKKRKSSVRKRDARYMREKMVAEEDLPENDFDPTQRRLSKNNMDDDSEGVTSDGCENHKRFFTPRESITSFRLSAAKDCFEEDDLLDRLSKLETDCRDVPLRHRQRRASTNDVHVDLSPRSPKSEDLDEIPEMVWDWGKMPRPAMRPPELKHMLLERISIDSPPSSPTKNRAVSATQNIRRRRRFDSEPAMAYEGGGASGLIVSPVPPVSADLLIASPVSETCTNDSGTGSLNNNAVIDDENNDESTVDPNEVSMSLCGGLQANNEIDDIDAFEQKLVSYDDFNANPKKFIANPLLIVRLGQKYYNWQAASALFFSLIMFDKPIDDTKVDELQQISLPKQSWFRWGSRTTSVSSVTPTRGKTDTFEKQLERSMSDPGEINDEIPPRRPSEVRSLELSSADLKLLDLNYGENEICFWVTTMYQGTCRVFASIYKWKETDKVVISDIDGTITKSDLMGYIFPTIGKDWTQEGVTKLYKRVYDNGYKFMYLSSRAIGQASMTKNYLDSVKQNGLTLPRGPVMLNPTSLFMAFHKEVIAREPEKFKISCLQGIKNIFPNSQKINPFWAGFGNRHTDVKSYSEVGIDHEHIFVINHLGELKQQGKIKNYTISYPELEDKCDHFFPNAKGIHVETCKTSRLCSSASYWTPDLPDIDFDDVL